MSMKLYDSLALGAQSGDDGYLRIGELAARTGLTQRTIRYYEEVGLLPPPTRTHGDYRLYGLGDVGRLQKIIRLRDVFGFSLADIRETIDAEETIEQLRTEFRSTEDAQARIGKLDQALMLTQTQLALLEGKVAQMQELKAELEGRLNKYATRRKELVAALEPV